MTVRHSPDRKSLVSLGLILASAVTAAFTLLPSATFAEPPAAQVPASQQSYYGVLNEDNVYVRSGPSDVYYATAKLNKGAKITVVAVRDTWLKIIPPEGSYCYVARAYVEKRGDGSIGRVTKPELNVRAGSLLNGLKTTVQTSLAEGDDVKIVGEQEEYFKIAPPPGAYLYIQKNFVDALPAAANDPPIVAAVKTGDPIPSAPIPTAIQPPVQTLAPQPGQPPVQQASMVPAVPVTPPVPAQPPIPVPPAAAQPPVAMQQPVQPQPPIQPRPVVAPVASPGQPPVATPASGSQIPAALALTPALSPTTNPAVASGEPATRPAVAMAPATQPTGPTAEERFDTLETAFLDATRLPLDQQPVDKMLVDYSSLVADAKLPSSMRQISEMRVSTLKMRSEARKDFVDAQKMQADARARQQALKAENQELAQKAKDQQVTVYTAVGTLRISSLQQSGPTLYRLTDPGTGRTLVYVKSSDPKYAGLLGQFIGLKGDITEEANMNLKVIAPTSVDTVDVTKVNVTVTATVLPPSLLPKNSTASLGN